MVSILEVRRLETLYGVWTEYVYGTSGADIIAMVHGAPSEAEECLVRIHSSCISAHYLASVECDCREQLALSCAAIQDEGAGVVLILDQEGRGNGHVPLIRAARQSRDTGLPQGHFYRSQGYPEDARKYDEAVDVLKELGVRKVSLLSNNPSKISAIEDSGIPVEPTTLVIDHDEGGHIARYYSAKRSEGQFC